MKSDYNNVVIVSASIHHHITFNKRFLKPTSHQRSTVTYLAKIRGFLANGKLRHRLSSRVTQFLMTEWCFIEIFLYVTHGCRYNEAFLQTGNDVILDLPLEGSLHSFYLLNRNEQQPEFNNSGLLKRFVITISNLFDVLFWDDKDVAYW